jgi:hypothetical protein
MVAAGILFEAICSVSCPTRKGPLTTAVEYRNPLTGRVHVKQHTLERENVENPVPIIRKQSDIWVISVSTSPATARKDCMPGIST